MQNIINHLLIVIKWQGANHHVTGLASELPRHVLFDGADVIEYTFKHNA